MHHGSLATITENGIRFSSDLLTPLSIRNGTSVYAAYYPTPPQYNHSEIYHDFMITYVPFDCWLFSGRLRVWLKQQIPGGLQRFSDVLNSNGMSIISSEASRSGHRYATCTTTICVESLMRQYHNQSITLEKIADIKKEVEQRINNCLQDIETNCDSYLFSDNEALGLEKPVTGERLDSLSYFYERAVRAGYENLDDIRCKPWQFTCKSGVLCPTESTSLFMKTAIENSLPSRAFAEMNTREAHIRLAVIPTNSLQEFGWVVVNYQWRDPTIDGGTSDLPIECIPAPSNRSIVSEITEMISTEHNIWRFFTHVISRGKSFEEGSVEFFVRSLDRARNPTMKWDRFRQYLESVALRISGAKITKSSVTPIAFMRIFLSARTNSQQRTNLLDICTEVGSHYGMLRQDFRTVETYTRNVIPTVVTEIRNCHAMIQYYGNMENDPNNYDWLHAELLAAQVLDMPVVAIVEGDPPRDRIKTLGDKAVLKIPQNPSKEKITEAIQTALAEINNMRFNTSL